MFTDPMYPAWRKVFESDAAKAQWAGINMACRNTLRDLIASPTPMMRARYTHCLRQRELLRVPPAH